MKTDAPIADLVDTLMSSGQSREAIVRHVRAAEETLRHRLAELTTYRDEGEADRKRKREIWSRQKTRQRAGGGDNSGDESAGHGKKPAVNALLSNNSKKDSQEEVKEEGENHSGARNEKRGSTISDEWKPNEKHYAIGVELGMTEQDVDRDATAMRDWAVANRNRAVARKADWDATFRNWLRANNRRRNGGHPNAPRGGNGSALGRMARGGR